MLVAVPAPVPELGASRGLASSSARASGYCSGWKITTTRGLPRRSSARTQAPGRAGAATTWAIALRQPQRRAVGDGAAARPRRRRARCSRSCAWSRRMKRSSGRGSSSTRRRVVAAPAGTAVAVPPCRCRRSARPDPRRCRLPVRRRCVVAVCWRSSRCRSTRGTSRRADFGVRGDAAHVHHPRLDRPARAASARRSCACGSPTTTPSARRGSRARRTGTVAVVTTLVALAGAAVRRRRSPTLLLGTARRDARAASAILGLWAFTNLEMAYALLRVEERRRAFLAASMANVAADRGAHGDARRRPRRGRAAGYLARQLRRQRRRAGRALGVGRARRLGVRRGRYPLSPMLRFGLPTVPAEAAVFALNVIDRAYLLRVGVAGRRRPVLALAVKLATVVIVAVRGVPARVAAAGLLDHRRRRGAAALRHGHDVVRRRSSASSSPALALLGALDRATSSRRRTSPPRTRRCRWVALGWALYGLFLAARHGRGPRARHDPQRAGRVRRARGERRRPAPARPAAGHRGRGHRAVRRLRRDARGRCTC